MKRSGLHQGFTLIEILIVIVIIVIATVAGVQMLNSNSVERQILHQVHNLKASINYACNQSTFENAIYGVHFFNTGYGFSKLEFNQWQERASESLPFVELDEDWRFKLFLDEQAVPLESNKPKKPQIICQPSGEKSQFELQIGQSATVEAYVIETVDLWTLDGRWLDEK